MSTMDQAEGEQRGNQALQALRRKEARRREEGEELRGIIAACVRCLEVRQDLLSGTFLRSKR